mmetsp:Transcript_17110/g.25315  ORF Transcript_17110/g.25315 Transcript_17110/m.25315 type:complete len:239 (-) Transcript_17110:159-875(-)
MTSVEDRQKKAFDRHIQRMEKGRRKSTENASVALNRSRARTKKEVRRSCKSIELPSTEIVCSPKAEEVEGFPLSKQWLNFPIIFSFAFIFCGLIFAFKKIQMKVESKKATSAFEMGFNNEGRAGPKVLLNFGIRGLLLFQNELAFKINKTVWAMGNSFKEHISPSKWTLKRPSAVLKINKFNPKNWGPFSGIWGPRKRSDASFEGKECGVVSLVRDKIEMAKANAFSLGIYSKLGIRS